MKILSIVIPCFNSQDYMRKCIESLLIGGEDVEILIVNDGSKDATAEIADEYANKYPSIVRAFHQENGGHGEAVNTGIANATGLYFKVVDSDDWVDRNSYEKILATLKDFVSRGVDLNMLISNYVYENDAYKHKRVVRYQGILPENCIFTWNDTKRFRIGQYILMHSVIYRTKLLHDCKLKLPKHTFYVDNLYVFQPLPYVKSMYYLNVDFYRYFIGRDDQSVNEKNMIKRIDQQLYVNRQMINTYNHLGCVDKKLQAYMFDYLEIITIVSSIMAIRSGTEENYQKKKALWNEIRRENPRMYRKLRVGIMGQAVNLPGRSGRKISSFTYQVTQKVMGFN